MSDYGQRHRPPATADTGTKNAPDEPRLPGSSVETDREWARNRLANHFRTNPRDVGAGMFMRKPAENQAEHHQVADRLHGSEGIESKAANRDGQQSTKEEAPAVRAMLEGVGRKIHLSPKQNRSDQKKNPADASVKRMGRAGQDKEQIKESLGKIAHERSAAVEELTQLQRILPTLGLPRVREAQANVSLQTALNALNHHLSDADITGAMRDTVGDPVRQPGSGKDFDHLNEVQGAVAALANTRTNLTRLRTELARRQMDPKILAEKLDPALNALTNVVQSVGQALKKMQP